MLKKRHPSYCCYRRNGDFNPTYHGWLSAHNIYIYIYIYIYRERERERERESEREKKNRMREREREREREVASTTEESKMGERC